MNVVEHDGLLKASRITGPKHNYLGIAFSEIDKGIELIEKQLPDDKDSKNLVNKSSLIGVVQEVVDIEAKRYGQQLFISKIEFVPTDSSDFLAYAKIARAIATYALEKTDLD